MDPKVAKKMIKEVDKARENYRLRFSEDTENDFDGYDIMIDSSRFGVDETAEILSNIIKNRFL
jgi:cytidylate kinase